MSAIRYHGLMTTPIPFPTTPRTYSWRPSFDETQAVSFQITHALAQATKPILRDAIASILADRDDDLSFDSVFGMVSNRLFGVTDTWVSYKVEGSTAGTQFISNTPARDSYVRRMKAVLKEMASAGDVFVEKRSGCNWYMTPSRAAVVEEEQRRRIERAELTRAVRKRLLDEGMEVRQGWGAQDHWVELSPYDVAKLLDAFDAHADAVLDALQR